RWIVLELVSRGRGGSRDLLVRVGGEIGEAAEQVGGPRSQARQQGSAPNRGVGMGGKGRLCLSAWERLLHRRDDLVRLEGALGQCVPEDRPDRAPSRSQ